MKKYLIIALGNIGADYDNLYHDTAYVRDDVDYDWDRTRGSHAASTFLVKDVVAEVPEPSTIAVFALGMIGLASRRLKKQS